MKSTEKKEKKENPLTKKLRIVMTFFLVLFITLKFADVGLPATWSWVWVLSPLWIPAVVALILFSICHFIINPILRRIAMKAMMKQLELLKMTADEIKSKGDEEGHKKFMQEIVAFNEMMD